MKIIKLLIILALITSCSNLLAKQVKDSTSNANQDFVIAGEYSDSTSWKWKVAVIKKAETKDELIAIAKKIFQVYPKQRIHIFDDKQRIKQFIDRQNYINDISGKAKEVPYDGEWVNKHHVANINDRSGISTDTGIWQLTTSEYSEHISYLESNIPPIKKTPPSYKGNTVENAQKLCSVFDQGGLLSESCSVHGWGQYVEISIDTSAKEAKTLCNTVVKQLRDNNTRFDVGWEIKIISPFSNGKAIAICKLPS